MLVLCALTADRSQLDLGVSSHQIFARGFGKVLMTGTHRMGDVTYTYILAIPEVLYMAHRANENHERIRRVPDQPDFRC